MDHEMDCCHRYKDIPRSEEFTDDLQRRLNRAIGQLNGIKRMIDDNRYCGDVLIQLSAAEQAVHTISMMVLRDHLDTCISDKIKAGDESAVDEVMSLLKRFS